MPETSSLRFGWCLAKNDGDLYFLVSSQDRKRYRLTGFRVVNLCGQFRNRIDRLSLETEKDIAANRVRTESVDHLP
jgi:hypothetical protein